MQRRACCFLQKFTQMAQILHDCRSRRSRQISTLASKCGTCSLISRLNICCLSASKTSLEAIFASTLLLIRTWWTQFILPRGVFLSHPLYPSFCSGVGVLNISRQYHIWHESDDYITRTWRMSLLDSFMPMGFLVSQCHRTHQICATMVPALPTSDWLS